MEHRDPYAGSLRCHLGLSTPNSDACWISVDGVRYSWRDGEGVLFDETYVHHAANETGTDRLILFCDVERPMHGRLAQAANRWFGDHAMRATRSRNQRDEGVGAVNVMFGQVYKVRLLGKRLKAWNVRVCYAVRDPDRE